MPGHDIERLIGLLARLPGLGPRSARRVALYLLARKEDSMIPLTEAMEAASVNVRTCSICGNLDTVEPCAICADPARDPSTICVVEDVSGLWAIERAGFFHGRYHVLGGLLSALDGIGPEDLRIDQLTRRAREPEIQEIILATPVNVDGQTTAHYVAECLAGFPVTVSGLARGVPIGGDLDYLDDGTIGAALKARRPI